MYQYVSCLIRNLDKVQLQWLADAYGISLGSNTLVQDFIDSWTTNEQDCIFNGDVAGVNVDYCIGYWYDTLERDHFFVPLDWASPAKYSLDYLWAKASRTYMLIYCVNICRTKTKRS